MIWLPAHVTPFPLWCPYIFFSSLCLWEAATPYLIWPLRESLPLHLVVIEGVCIAAKWTCNVISCFFPISACWQLTREFWISPPANWDADGEAMSPPSAPDPGDRVGAARGEGGRNSHTVSTLQPGCLGSSVSLVRLNHLPGCLPRFQLGWGLPVLKVEGQQQNTHALALLWGVHIIVGGDSSQAYLAPHSPRFSFGSSDSWSKCVFLSLMMRASAKQDRRSLKSGEETNVFPVLWVPVCGGPNSSSLSLCLTSIFPLECPSCRLRDPNIRWLDGKAIALQRLLKQPQLGPIKSLWQIHMFKELPRGPTGRTLSFHCWGHRFIRFGNNIPQALPCGAAKKRKYIYSYLYFKWYSYTESTYF